MSEPQFIQFCKTLKIDYENRLIFNFFNNFLNYQELKYEVKTLSTLGVLLCQGTLTEKVKILFQTYDENLNMILSLEEAQKMFDDISYISLECLPAFAGRFEQSSEFKLLLYDYQQKLKNMGKVIRNYYISLIFEYSSNKEMHIDQFLRVFSNKIIKRLLTPSLFRKNTFKVFKLISKATNATQIVLEDSNQNSNNLLEEIKSITSTERTSKSNSSNYK
jgi:Ca2+-binding EF-hand superfamily protein